MVPLAAQIDRYRLRETEAALANAALDALLGYAAAHDNRLPCPDLDGDGMEDRPGPASAPCRGIEGELPRATLGVPGRDGWGRPLRYRGNDALTGPGGIPRPPNTRGGLRIDNPRTGERLTVGDPEAPAAILFSCGANGRPDDENDGTGGSPAGCTNPLRPDPRYAHAVPGRPGSGGFDDVLVWDVEERAPRPAGAGRHLAVRRARNARTMVRPAATRAVRIPDPVTPQHEAPKTSPAQEKVTWDARRAAGFTLIEIAIVLVVIGLLVGAVLTGQELIASARVRNLADSNAGIRSAYFAFVDRYRRIPGDWNATEAGEALGVAVNGGGNDNGVIDTASGSDWTEPNALWEQLAKAGFLQGEFEGDAVAPTPDQSAGSAQPVQPGHGARTHGRLPPRRAARPRCASTSCSDAASRSTSPASSTSRSTTAPPTPGRCASP